MITAKEFLKNNAPNSTEGFMIEFAKMHVEAALNAADVLAGELISQGEWEYIEDSEFILNSYPLTIIK